MALDTDGNARAAAPDGQDNLLDQVGPGVGKGNAVLDHARINPLALQNLAEELVRVGYLFGGGEKPDKLTESVLRRACAQAQVHVFDVDHIGENDSH